MPTRYPTEAELLELFEVEPVSTTGDPWPYRQDTYEVRRGGTVLRLTLSPSNGQVALSLACGGATLLDLRLEGVRAWRTQASGPHQFLELSFAKGSLLHPLTVELRPGLCVRWGADA